MSISKLTIGKKLALICAGLIVLSAIQAAITVYAFSSVRNSVRTLSTGSVPAMENIERLGLNFHRWRGDLMRHIASTEPSEMAAIESEMAEAQTLIQQSEQGYEGTISLDQDRRQLETLRASVQKFAGSIAMSVQMSRELKKNEAYKSYLAQGRSQYLSTAKLIRQMDDWNRDNAGQWSNTALKSCASALWLTLLAACFALITGGTGAWLVVRGVNASLRHSISELTSCADQFVGAAGQVASASQSLAQGASEQAASLEETSASSEEINAMARQNTDNSGVAANLMGAAQKNFDVTNRTLQEMVEAMNEISASSDKISKIIKVIDEIAFQTNILALNAAVEAARAGEAGMGFAVVADEVRNLSQRCAQAAKDTAILIQDSISRSNDGRAKVDQVSNAIRVITDESSKIRTLVQEINAGSQDQAKGIDQVGKALSQIERVTQSNAANAEQSASAASELTAQAEALRNVVDSLAALVQARPLREESEFDESACSPAGDAPNYDLRTEEQSQKPVYAGVTALSSKLGTRAQRDQRQSRDLTLSDAENLFPLEEDFKEF